MATLAPEEKPKEAAALPTDGPPEPKEKSHGGLFKKHSLNPSPGRSRKPTVTSKEDVHLLTDSVTSIPEKEEQRKHSFLNNLFSRKHQPPSSLENLSSKPSVQPACSTTLTQMEEGNRPVEHLFPLKEMDALEEAEQPPALPSQPDQLWTESVDFDEQPVEIHVPPPQIVLQSQRRVDEALHEREQVQQALEACLEDFRAGKMRSLTDSQVAKIRGMAENQLGLNRAPSRQIMRDDPIMDDPHIDSCFAKLAELHKSCKRPLSVKGLD
ncbi:hypothetical protein M3Y99_01860700 [Aphelenchoides fujianensis]|nr:hypothetical protein M3Y99_01860700 [Aphelenchoides fujianensis]